MIGCRFDEKAWKGLLHPVWLGLKFIYSEKATKFCEIFPLLLITVHTVKSKGKISQNFVAFSEYMNSNLLSKEKKMYGESPNVRWNHYRTSRDFILGQVG